MLSRSTRRRLLAGGAGGAMALLAGCTSMTPFVGQRIATHFALPGDDVDRLAVIGRVGSITIAGEDRDDIDVDVVKQSSSLRTDLDDLTVETSVRGGLLEIRTEYAGETGVFESPPSVDLDIAVPRSLVVEHVESAVGEATIRDVAGDLRVEASTASVTVEDVDGSVEVRTSTGHIAIAGVTGTASASASTGRVTLRNVGATGDIRTSTGRIEAEVPAIEGDTRISTNTGRIEAAVASELDADVIARSDTGRVTYDRVPLTDVTSTTNSVRGRLGDGGPTLEFQASTGRIALGPLD